MPLKPSTQLYLAADARRNQQTQETKESVLSYFLSSGDFQDTPRNRDILRHAMGESFYNSENLQRATEKVKRQLEHRPKPNRPLGRTTTEAELKGLFDQVVRGTPWFALTTRNVDIVSQIFIWDPRVRSGDTVADFVEAVKIADREHTLDKNIPAPPKPIRYEEGQLQDWQLPLEAPDFVLRKSSTTKAQVQDLIQRRLARDKWLKENEQ